MVKVYVINGLGIGCHEETAHAYRTAGADTEIVHINKLLNGTKALTGVQVINFSGGFLHGDKLGAGMCAANILEHTVLRDGRKIKDILLRFAENGGIIYGQCNGFQLLVKTGLLPGIDGDYSKQTLTLTHNDCGIYRDAPVLHKPEGNHFAFAGISEIYIWCRHGEGKLVFNSEYGLVSEEEGEHNRAVVNADHVILRYIDPVTHLPTSKFPDNPNGSIDGIAGLASQYGNIFGHMAHTEVGINILTSPLFYKWKDDMRRAGHKAADLTDKLMEDRALEVFRNIVRHAKHM